MNKKTIVIEKYLPHNFLAEKMILNSLLVSFEAIELTIQVIPSEAFYFKNHQEIYKAIIFLYQTKSSIDILSLTMFLQDNGLLEKIGGVTVLLDLINQVPNLIYLDEYIKLVKDKFLRRSLIKFGYKLINSSYITNVPLENLLTTLEIEFFTLINEKKIKRITSSAEILNKMFFDLKKKFLNPTLPGLSSGFSNLDLLTQGFQKSDLIIIAGRPSMGKTAFSLNIAVNAIKLSKLPVLFFSLEMSKEQIMYRILGLETNINQIRLKNGNLYQTDWIKLNKIIKIFSKFPLFIDDTGNLSIQDLRKKIKKIFVEQTTIGLIIIDYLQLMKTSNSKFSSRVQELSELTRGLKTIAREFNIPVIALSQLSRNVENRIDQKPLLSDLRESGSIEQDADLVLMLSQGKKPLLTELIIAKQRNGPTGVIEFNFNKNITKFQELQ